MLTNKETVPYRMGLQPFYYYQSSPPVQNERLGGFHPITPPYHYPYEFVLPMNAVAAAVAAAAGRPVPTGSRPSSTSSASFPTSPLFFDMDAQGVPARDAYNMGPLSPPHTPPLPPLGPTGPGRSHASPLMAVNQYGLSSPASAGEPTFASGAGGEGGATRHSVIMKVQNQQVVPMQRDTDANLPSEEELAAKFICRWKGCVGVFFKLEDLASHVTQKHAVIGLDGLYYCRWARCLRQDRGFNARYKMLVHVRTHTKEKPHQCSKCFKCFSRAENLKIHLRSHTGEKPYVCPVEGCGKSYSNSSDRFKHTRTHSNDKPYVCKMFGCNKRYTDPSSLRKHVKTFKHPSQQTVRPDVCIMDFESYSQDSTRSDATGSHPSAASSPPFTGHEQAGADTDDTGDHIDVVGLGGRCEDGMATCGDYERFHRTGQTCGQPDCRNTEQQPCRGDPSMAYWVDEMRERAVRSAADDGSDYHSDAHGDESTVEGWEFPAVANKIPPDSNGPMSAGPCSAEVGGDDGRPIVPPDAIEDDELCSAIRQLNGRPKARMLTMDVDGALDLSMHHR